MVIKKFGNKVFGADLNAQERKALMIEINKQVLEADTHYTNNIDAMVLWALHEYLGFGPKRLRDFYEAFGRVHEQLREYYQMEDEDGPWLAMTKLKEMGVNVEQWNREKYPQLYNKG